MASQVETIGPARDARGRFTRRDALGAIEVVKLASGVIAHRVGGLYFADRADARRYSLAVVAKAARLASVAPVAPAPMAKAEKAPRALRLRLAARKADRLMDRANRRAHEACSAAHSACRRYSELDPQRAWALDAKDRACEAHRFARNRADRLWAALNNHVAARLARTA